MASRRTRQRGASNSQDNVPAADPAAAPIPTSDWSGWRGVEESDSTGHGRRFAQRPQVPASPASSFYAEGTWAAPRPQQQPAGWAASQPQQQQQPWPAWDTHQEHYTWCLWSDPGTRTFRTVVKVGDIDPITTMAVVRLEHEYDTFVVAAASLFPFDYALVGQPVPDRARSPPRSSDDWDSWSCSDDSSTSWPGDGRFGFGSQATSVLSRMPM